MTDKILFVDDEPVLLQGYERLLRKEFQVVTAAGGAAGLALLQREGPFAVVISDMRMPEMDGVDFLTRARKAAPDTVRIMSDRQCRFGCRHQGRERRPCFPLSEQALE